MRWPQDDNEKTPKNQPENDTDSIDEASIEIEYEYPRFTLSFGSRRESFGTVLLELVGVREGFYATSPHRVPLFSLNRQPTLTGTLDPLVELPKTLLDGARGTASSESKTWKLFENIVNGIIFMHSQDIVCSDLQPQNIVLTAEGCIKVGGARTETDNGRDYKRHSETPGRGLPVAYMAPETIRGLRSFQRKIVLQVGKLADVYGAGCLLIFMLTGKDPQFYRQSVKEGTTRMSLNNTRNPRFSIALHVGQGGSPDLSFCETGSKRQILNRCIQANWKRRMTMSQLLQKVLLETLGSSKDIEDDNSQYEQPRVASGLAKNHRDCVYENIPKI